jgi:dihydrofolate reductase
VTKTQYYTATSMDGFLADADGELDWLFEADAGTPDRFKDYFAQVGAFAMGATTYEWVYAHEHLADEPARWRESYAGMLEAAQGRNIWLVGGGELVGHFADQGLLDEILLGVAPATLGAGAPLLPRRLTASRLTLTGVEQAGQFANLTYAVS